MPGSRFRPRARRRLGSAFGYVKTGMPGAGLEPARPQRGHLIFKSPLRVSVYLGRSELFLLTRPLRPPHQCRRLGLSRRVSLALLTPPPRRVPGEKVAVQGRARRRQWVPQWARAAHVRPADSSLACASAAARCRLATRCPQDLSPSLGGVPRPWETAPGTAARQAPGAGVRTLARAAIRYRSRALTGREVPPGG